MNSSVVFDRVWQLLNACVETRQQTQERPYHVIWHNSITIYLADDITH